MTRIKLKYIALLCIFSALLCIAFPAHAETTAEYTLASGRTYLLDVPDSPPASPKPALVYLHGLYGNGAVGKGILGLDVDGKDFVVAYPNGTMIASNPLSRSWNAGNCCSTAYTSNINDVDYLSQVINDLITNRGVDASRVYIAGHSNGALMAFRFACERPWKIAGMMTVGGVKTTTGYCSSAINRPWLHIHGAMDDMTPVVGGATMEPGHTTPPLIDTITAMTARGMALEMIMPAEAVHSMESLNTALFPESVAELIAERVK